MAEELKATFRIVTPMFLGGPRPEIPELRPPAIKGALRFWWRAMQWGVCSQDAGGQERAALRLLHQREAGIFGVASGDRGGRQSTFRQRARTDSELKVAEPPRPMSGQKYLLGQGLFHFQRSYQRRAIAADQKFTVHLSFRRKADSEASEQVEQALMLLGLLGGLGSRARRGFGSIVLENLEGSGLQIPRDVAAFKKLLDPLVADRVDSLPPFTAFSRQSWIDCSRTAKDPWKLLDEVGTEMLMYRSYGRGGYVDLETPDHRPRREPAEQNFQGDHDSARDATLNTCPQELPRRIVFGLPHNYYFSSSNKSASFEPEAGSDGRKLRRASPLLIHIHRFPDGTCAAIQSFLPAKFLPGGLAVRVKSPGQRPHRVGPFVPSWKVIHDYLNRFADRKELLR